MISVTRRRPGFRVWWNSLLDRAIWVVNKGAQSPDEIREGLRFSGKRPNVQVRGLTYACSMLLDRNELLHAKEVADEIVHMIDSHGLKHEELATGLRNAALAYERNGDWPTALATRERLLVLENDHHGPLASQTLIAKGHLAIALRGTGRISEAVAIQRDLREETSRQAGRESHEVAKVEAQLGITLIDLGCLDEAKDTLQHAVHVIGESNPEARSARAWLAHVLARMGELKEALRLRELTAAQSVDRYGPDDRRTLHDADEVATTLWRLGERNRARVIMERSLASRERVLGDEDPDTAQARDRLAALVREIGPS